MNPVAQSLTGWKSEEALTIPLDTIFPIIHEDTREKVENRVQKVLDAGLVVGLGNHTVLIAKDGTETAIEDSASPIRDLNGKAIGVVLIFRDVTEHRQQNKRKDEFLALLGHELRNPLAPIRNALHIISQPSADEALVRKMQGMMERQVTHMTRMVDDLLDVSRITRGKIELRRQPVDLGLLLQHAVDLVRPSIAERKHTINVDVPAEPIMLDADPARLEQIVSNLLNNANKYTENGGTITVTARQERAEAVLRIKDTGCGIPPDMLGRIFEPFVQCNRVLHRSQGGLGIGLTLVKRLVELHDGRIEVNSTGINGSGSEFVVRLPLVSPEPPIATLVLDEDQRTVKKEKCRILVVDDNPDAAESLAVLLQMEGHKVEVVFDGRSAVESVATSDGQPFDIMFLDIGMPGMNGYEMIEQVRKMDSHGMRIVAITGYGQDIDKRRTREAGFDDHMTKPVDPDRLRSFIAVHPCQYGAR